MSGTERLYLSPECHFGFHKACRFWHASAGIGRIEIQFHCDESGSTATYDCSCSCHHTPEDIFSAAWVQLPTNSSTGFVLKVIDKAGLKLVRKEAT